MGPIRSEPEVRRLAKNERLRGISKDYHVRPNNGEFVAYIVQDKSKQFLFIGQKLSQIASHINSVAEAPEKVSTSNLYKSTFANGGVRGGFAKYRWKTKRCRLKEAADVFESIRNNYTEPTLIGAPECFYTHLQ